MKREPILIITALNLFFQAVIVLLIVFYTDWSRQEAAAVNGVLAGTLNLAAAFFGRSLITPVEDPRDNDGNPLEQQGLARAAGRSD